MGPSVALLISVPTNPTYRRPTSRTRLGRRHMIILRHLPSLRDGIRLNRQGRPAPKTPMQCMRSPSAAGRRASLWSRARTVSHHRAGVPRRRSSPPTLLDQIAGCPSTRRWGQEFLLCPSLPGHPRLRHSRARNRLFGPLGSCRPTQWQVEKALNPTFVGKRSPPRSEVTASWCRLRQRSCLGPYLVSTAYSNEINRAWDGRPSGGRRNAGPPVRVCAHVHPAPCRAGAAPPDGP